ncbi:MAG: 30S ribosomal protein S16 [Candidatus Vogelbacteria bacterium CG10_big_fil_rev_8_21_14_0_10_45_14]|uniref:Small ribosomal subunit protein bS16 n=1 Tax=Candidatus Vogelbacteria bacterium CG10_big_fil_rev_8_21_14_0_10_45_14 TaxID=1975042 RepID=A0A2H0RK52_9BACT|nr:MAG: 30S ribosomal protein S16 [Candidatus Vogelbacteria bacterium CG10_big_fil_rev_8_21_14_0_10_45_14]
MLMIRLLRVGRKHDPSFRVVVTDKRNSTKSGRFIELLGFYDARTDKVELKGERISYWLSVGAKPSGTVNNLLVDAKILAGKKINVLPKKNPPPKTETEVATPSNALSTEKESKEPEESGAKEGEDKSDKATPTEPVKEDTPAK